MKVSKTSLLREELHRTHGTRGVLGEQQWHSFCGGTSSVSEICSLPPLPHRLRTHHCVRSHGGVTVCPCCQRADPPASQGAVALVSFLHVFEQREIWCSSSVLPDRLGELELAEWIILNIEAES